MARVSRITFEQRVAEKEAARRADDLAIAEGRKTPEQIKLESESFAFGPDRAKLDLSAPQPLLVDDYAYDDGLGYDLA